jgi:hypothetical protein
MYTPSEKGAPVQQIFTSVVSIHSVTWLLSIPNLRANRTAENRGWTSVHPYKVFYRRYYSHLLCPFKIHTFEHQ